jgi:hypothetical protein
MAPSATTKREICEAGMSKTFRYWSLDQALPPSMDDFVLRHPLNIPLTRENYRGSAAAGLTASDRRLRCVCLMAVLQGRPSPSSARDEMHARAHACTSSRGRERAGELQRQLCMYGRH